MFEIVIAAIIIGLAVLMVKRRADNKRAAVENISAGQRFLAENQQRDEVTTTDSGLQHEVLQPGTGEQHPTATDRVKVHYHGTLIDGSVFDSSVKRGQSISFGLNQVIPGWTEGLQLMVTGEKRRLYIPYQLAYGTNPAGMIPPGSTLIFDVELLAINEG